GQLFAADVVVGRQRIPALVGKAQWRGYAAFCHSARLAIRAPSANAANLTQTTLGWTSQVAAKLAKPQSAPAMTFSRPTAPAKRPMRSAISSGCSTMFEEWVMTPGMTDLPSGNLASAHSFHSCSWRGLAASKE